RDSSFALAYARLSATYVSAGTNSFLPRREAYDRGRSAALAALRLDDRLAEAHNALGGVLFRSDWDWNGAGQHFRRAIELNRSLSSAHQGYAYLLALLGKSDEGVKEAKLARSLDPLARNVVMGVTFMLAGQHTEAVGELQRVLQLAP